LVASHKFSISQVTTPRWSFEQDVIAYSKLKVDGMGVWETKLLDYGVERGIELLESYSMPVSVVIPVTANILPASPSWNLVTPLPDPPVWKHRLNRLESMIDSINLVSRLQAQCMVVVTGDRGEYSKEEATARVVGSLGDMMKEAEDKNVCLALEPLHRTRAPGLCFVTNIPESMDIINQVDHDNIGLLFDTYHLWDTPNVLEDISEAKGKVFGVHVNDWKPTRREVTASDDRQILGKGVIPLREILHALDKAGYDEFYEFEIVSQETDPESPWKLRYESLIRQGKEEFERLWATQ